MILYHYHHHYYYYCYFSLTYHYIFYSLLFCTSENQQVNSIVLASRALYLLQLQITEVWTSESGSTSKSHLEEFMRVRPLQKEEPSSIFSLLIVLKGKLPQLSQTVLWVLEKCFSVDPQLKGFFYYNMILSIND